MRKSGSARRGLAGWAFSTLSTLPTGSSGSSRQMKKRLGACGWPRCARHQPATSSSVSARPAPALRRPSPLRRTADRARRPRRSRPPLRPSRRSWPSRGDERCSRGLEHLAAPPDEANVAVLAQDGGVAVARPAVAGCRPRRVGLGRLRPFMNSAHLDLARHARGRGHLVVSTRTSPRGRGGRWLAKVSTSASESNKSPSRRSRSCAVGQAHRASGGADELDQLRRHRRAGGYNHSSRPSSAGVKSGCSTIILNIVGSTIITLMLRSTSARTNSGALALGRAGCAADEREEPRKCIPPMWLTGSRSFRTGCQHHGVDPECVQLGDGGRANR